MRKFRETGLGRKILSAATATVLAVGLVPLPAFATDLQAGSIDMAAQAESSEGYVVCAAYAAAEPAPQILGLNNPQYRSQVEAENVAAIFGQATNSAADPFLVNMLNGDTPAPIYGGRQGSPMSALMPYNTDSDAGTLARSVWNMKPQIVLGTGSDAIPENEATFYDTDEYARAAEAANGWTANSYHPIGVTYNRVDLNAMINTMYRLALAADQVVADSNGALKTRYDSALSIAKDYERYITGAKGYVLKNIKEGKVAQRSFVCIQSYDSEAGAFMIRPSGISQEGTATRNRLIEAVQGVADNYYDKSASPAVDTQIGNDSVALKTVTVDELKNSADLIIVNVNAGSDTEDGIVNALNSAGLLSKTWYATNMSAGAVFGTTVNSVENAQNVGRILPCLYPELLDQSDMIAFYYDTFYHIQTGSVAKVIGEKMDGVRNWNANSTTDAAANLQWSEADVEGYDRLAVEQKLAEGMDYMLSLSAAQIPDAVMTPTKYYSQGEVAPAPTPVTDTIAAADETGATVEAADADWAAKAIASVSAGVSLSSVTAPVALADASEAAAKVWQAAVDKGAKSVTAFDVSLYVLNSEGKPVAQLTDGLDVSVNLPVDAQYNNLYAEVTQIHNGQALEAQTVPVKDGKVTVTATQLSEFVVAIQADEAPVFSVYVKYGDNAPTLAKQYTTSALEALATTDGAPVSGLFNKGGWSVATALTYVTLEDLFADADVPWNEDAAIGYGGDPAQGKTANNFTYADLQNLKFYPKTTVSATDIDGAVDAPFVFGIKTSNSGIKIGDDQTAADVQAAAAEANTTEYLPYAIMGSLESEYTSADGGVTTAGKRLWRNVDAVTVTLPASQEMYRLYNPNSGEHFYTASAAERDDVVAAGWNDEGIGWVAPYFGLGEPVYRLYSGTDHHYTLSAAERDWLVEKGWSYEGIGWYSASGDEGKNPLDGSVALHRQFNPNVDPSAPRNNSGSHNYTPNKEENDNLVSLGWIAEGIAWYGVAEAPSAEK